MTSSINLVGIEVRLNYKADQSCNSVNFLLAFLEDGHGFQLLDNSSACLIDSRGYFPSNGSQCTPLLDASCPVLYFSSLPTSL